MTPEQFCYWLQGFGELNTEPPTAEQWKAIKEHLATVFQKVTPKAPGEIRALGPLTPDPFRDYRATPQVLPSVTCGPLVARC